VIKSVTTIPQENRSMKKTLVVLLAIGMLGCASSKPPVAAVETPPSPPKKEGGVKAYAEVITKEAKSDTGLVIIHKVKDKWYYEISKKLLGKDFLMVSSLEKTQMGLGYGGDEVNEQVVRWEKREDNILLQSIMYATVAADSLPVSYAVKKANFPPILVSFPVAAYTKDSTASVIDVSDVFTSDMAEFSIGKRARTTYQIRRLDPKRSFVESMKAFPLNIETRVTLTYEAGQVPAPASSLGTISVLMHHSMVLLPEKPMMPRISDDRIGYFGISQVDYGYDSQRAEPREYIARWRLEPKDTAVFLRGDPVEPIKPIVFYIDRGTPDKWRPYLKKGVEMWQPAFEKAGFKNAILAKDPPSEEEDPTWSGEDVRYATIRWLPSTIENAYGPHVSDPRTGEILDADIGFYHNVMNLARNWYFVQVGCVDPRAAKIPLPDDLMGELLQYIAAHEVGHSLGFQHNMKASSQYPVDSMRSKSFTTRYGTEASIMDYGRFNYIAQPGDGARLIPIIGPYDLFATEWGYRPVLGAKTPDEEKMALNTIALRAEKEPYLRFGPADGIDPSAQTEDLGGDAVAATKFGMANIRRIADMLVTATTKEGENYNTLREMYGQLIVQRSRELGHVAAQVGGVVRTERVAGIEGPVHTPVPEAKQREAMQYLIREAFRTPSELLKGELLALIEPSGAVERVLQGHRGILSTLLASDRLARMVNTQSQAGRNGSSYRLSEMLRDLRKGVWSELAAARVASDVYRRNLQRAYLDVVDTKLNPPAAQPLPAGVPPGLVIASPPAPAEARALLRTELAELDAAIARAIPAAADRETKAHLEDSRYRISKTLHPEKN